MSPEELSIIKDVASQINQTAGYSYHVLVQGMVITNIIDLLGVIIWFGLVFLITRKVWSKVNENGENSSDNVTFAGFIIIISAIALALVISITLGTIEKIVVPEYYVISTILGGIV